MKTLENANLPNDLSSLASLRSRLLASFADLLIIVPISIIIAYIISALLMVLFGDPTELDNAVYFYGQVFFLLIFILPAFYYYLSTAFFGQTLGKKILKIKVVDKNTFRKPGLRKAFVRETVSPIVFLPLLLGLGYLWAIFDKEKQTWADKFANTLVIKN